VRRSTQDWKLAADQGDAEAQFNYGLRLQNGEGVSKDLKGAADYFKLAADQSFAEAQYNYGVCLQNGEGVSKDLKRALYYFKLAADHGIAEAQFNYEVCLQVHASLCFPMRPRKHENTCLSTISVNGGG
jgi:TPR repeat protein